MYLKVEAMQFYFFLLFLLSFISLRHNYPSTSTLPSYIYSKVEGAYDM